MRVCFVSHSCGLGGAERFLLELVEGLQKLGVTCCVVLPGNGPLEEELRKRAIPSFRLRYTWWMGRNTPLWKRMAKTLFHMAGATALAKRLRELECDLVCTNTVTVCVGALAAKLSGLPHVWNIQEFGLEDHGLFFDLGSGPSLKLMARMSDAWVFLSRAVAQNYAPYAGACSLHQIYPSVTVTETLAAGWPQWEGSHIRCAIVGTLQAGKGQEDAVRAVAELSKAGIRVDLAIVGEGDSDYKRNLLRLIAEKGLSGQVKLLGQVRDPLPIMAEADAVLVCSRKEALGRVALEAMALGRPVIAAQAGGLHEIIREGYNGLLYTPGDSLDLAGQIRLVHNNPGLAKVLGQNGQEFVAETFGQDRYAREFLALLASIAEHGRAFEPTASQAGASPQSPGDPSHDRSARRAARKAAA